MLAKREPTSESALAQPVQGFSNPQRRREWLRLTLCASLVLLGLSVIAGWLFHIPLLTSVMPGFSTMKFNTAVQFVLIGSGLALAGAHNRFLRGLAGAIGLAILSIALATLVQYATNFDFRIDEAFVLDTGTLRGSGHPGRMSALTAFAFSFLGVAVLLLAIASRRAEVIVAHCLAVLAGYVSVLAAAGYAFGAEAFWGIGFYTFIAVHTAVGLLVAAAAALMTRAREGWLEPYVNSPSAIALLIRLLPVALGLPTLLGLLIMFGAGFGAYNAPYGFALFIPAISVAMVLAALWVAARHREEEEVRLRHERHLQLLVAELNHRVKNTLAIVQSFAHQSLKTSASPKEAGLAFEGRLSALASAHGVLTRENWDQVNLVELIGNSLDAHNDTGTRFAIEGIDIPVSPKTAITMAMTLHELATNSTKYGSLSQPDGFVRVSWGIEDGEFRFTWKDVDGPPVDQPLRSGFGTRMLTRALASELGGKASLTFEADGLRYDLRAPARSEL